MDGFRMDEPPDPAPRWSRGFADTPPRDLSGINLDLASLAGRTVPWVAHGILPPALMTGLHDLGSCAEPFEVHLTASPLHREGKIRIRVRGMCWGGIQLTCVRCLTDFPLPLEVELDALLAPGVDPASRNKRWQIEEDVVYLPEGAIRLAQLVEEELLLALPMNPVCFPGCAGLCAGCGADLNRNPCACRKATPTGPFAVLKTWKSS